MRDISSFAHIKIGICKYLSIGLTVSTVYPRRFTSAAYSMTWVFHSSFVMVAQPDSGGRNDPLYSALQISTDSAYNRSQDMCFNVWPYFHQAGMRHAWTCQWAGQWPSAPSAYDYKYICIHFHQYDMKMMFVKHFLGPGSLFVFPP